MGMFKKDDVENQEKDQEKDQEKLNQDQEKATESIQEKEKKKLNPGKFYNLRLIKILGAVITLAIVYNVVKTDNKPKKVEAPKKEETKDLTKKVNPYQTSYSELAEVKDITDNTNTTINTTNKNTTNNNTNINTGNSLTEEEKEKIRQFEEEARQAKKSPISFQLYKPENPQNNNGQNGNGFPPDVDLNRQNSKKNFLFNEVHKDLYASSTVIESVSPYELKTGDFFPAVVETAMNSDIFSKVIVARVSQNIYDTVSGKYLLIPQGTTLTGVYDSNITWGQERLLVIWQQLRFPNGDMLRLDNMQGVDMIGQAGIPGKVNNHFATLLKGVLLSSAMGAAAAITTNDDDDWKSDAGEAAGLSIVQIGDKYTTKALDRQPTIVIKAGDRFNVMIHSNLILKPYKK